MSSNRPFFGDVPARRCSDNVTSMFDQTFLLGCISGLKGDDGPTGTAGSLGPPGPPGRRGMIVMSHSRVFLCPNDYFTVLH